MNEEELRNRIIELEEQNKALSEEKDNALSQCSNYESEIKVLKEYNKKLFEKIPAVTSPIDADKQVGESEQTRDEIKSALYKKLMEE